MNTSLNCSNCKFFYDAKNGHGECRRHHPGASLIQQIDPRTKQPVMSALSFWPPVQASQWCGEHEVDFAQ